MTPEGACHRGESGLVEAGEADVLATGQLDAAVEIAAVLADEEADVADAGVATERGEHLAPADRLAVAAERARLVARLHLGAIGEPAIDFVTGAQRAGSASPGSTAVMNVHMPTRRRCGS